MLTIDKRHKMRLLMLSAVNIRGDPYQGIYIDTMYPTLKMQLQVLAFIAEELALFHNDSNLVGQPTRCTPMLLSFRACNCCIKHQDCRDANDGISSGESLVACTFTAPPSTWYLPFYA